MHMSDDRSRFGRPGEDRIDRAIDRAVRAMMHVDPAPGLRRRVLSRLEAPAARRPLVPAFGFAAAMLAVVLAAVFMLRSGPPATTTPQQASEVPAPAVTPAPVPPTPAIQAAAPPVTRPAERTRPTRDDGTIPMPRVGNVFGPPTGRVSSATVAGVRTTAPRVEPETSDAAPSETSSNSSGVPPIYIAPLEVTPIQVPPVGSGPRR
jgi:hypothetical protein